MLAVAVAVVSLLGWIYLLVGHGRFWCADQRLDDRLNGGPAEWPDVCAVVPARNEVSHVEGSLRSLLDQDYPGDLRVVLVDDASDDGTADRARTLAAGHARGRRLTVHAAPLLPSGWSGKLWAIHTGLGVAADAGEGAPRYFLLTDADVVHEPAGLRRLVAKAEKNALDLASLMVLLPVSRGSARLLIPAFVYFFQLLYPFRWVNAPGARTAAAAGGCVLVRSEALRRIGGIASIRSAVIDDCALARRVKAAGRIWLGLGRETYSTRAYNSLRDVWEMVARTAFDQLGYSAALLAATVLGLGILFLAPPALVVLAPGPGAWLGALAWAAMTVSFAPTLRLYGRPGWLGLALPAAALAYSAMTLDSARRHWTGAGSAWRGRRLRRPSVTPQARRPGPSSRDQPR